MYKIMHSSCMDLSMDGHGLVNYLLLYECVNCHRVASLSFVLSADSSPHFIFPHCESGKMDA